MTTVQLSERAERLVSLLPEAEVDVMLVTNLANVRYLCGYTGSNGLAIVGQQTRAFITDFRYVQQAAREVDSSFDRHQASLELVDLIENVLPSGPLRLGFEATSVTVHAHRDLREKLPDRVGLVAVEGLVERLRAVKEPQEIGRIREAARVADVALEDLLNRGLVGRTERDLAFAISERMHHYGAARPSFDAIVASGAHGALPHAEPRDVEIEPGQLVVVDWGAELDGYCSDCTRTLAAGTPGELECEVYEIVLEAQRGGLDAVGAGADARGVDSAARDVIEAAGYGGQFGHGLGHGVGLEIHERPRLSQRSDVELEAGNVVTVEPGIYLPGQFGVRIEDLVVVTGDGCEILTSIPKELRIVE